MQPWKSRIGVGSSGGDHCKCRTAANFPHPINLPHLVPQTILNDTYVNPEVSLSQTLTESGCVTNGPRKFVLMHI